MKRRRELIRMGVVAGSVLLGGCSDVSMPWEQPVGSYDRETPEVTPAEVSEDTPTETPKDTPTETPEDTPTEKPRDTPTETPQNTLNTEVFSFESIDPWFVRSAAGTVEISDTFVSEGSQSLHMSSYRDDLETTEFAIRIDLTNVETLRYDGYVEANNPNWGDIKVNLDGAGPNGENISNELINGFPPEDKWYYDVEEDVGSFTGNHTLILWVRGDGNDVYWDNFRFYDENGEELSASDIVTAS